MGLVINGSLILSFLPISAPAKKRIKILAILSEPCHEKICLRESPTRQDTNWPAQLQRQARILKFQIYKLEVIILSWQWTTKVLFRLRGCAGWSAPLLFTYGISHIFSWPGSFILSINKSTKAERTIKVYGQPKGQGLDRWNAMAPARDKETSLWIVLIKAGMINRIID